MIMTQSLSGWSPQHISNLMSIRKQSTFQLCSNNGIPRDHPRGKMLPSFSDNAFLVGMYKPGILEHFKSSLETNIYIFN